MSKNWKVHLLGVAAAALLANNPSTAEAAICGDLNNDGNRNIVDVLLMANCVAGLCNAATQCGGAGLADCGDTLGNGILPDAPDTGDLNQLVFSVAGLTTLHDLCAPIGTPIACGSQITGTITASQIWPACELFLDDTVFIEKPFGGPTPVITIQAGATIRGKKTTNNGPAALVFLTGTKIAAVGNPANPIVFTSDQPAGSRTKGDWGGIMFNGRGTVNRPNCLGSAEGVPSPFGGCDVNDSSGVARYIRAEFAGLPLSANNELNIWTMNGLGKGTDFSYIHANAGIDDCIEWFGGTNDMHHLVASGCADDGFDWQLGFTGTMQFGLYMAQGPLLDTGVDSRGIEADNSEFGNNDLPRSNPKMCNVTLVGPEDNAPDSDSGILLRRGTAGVVANVIVTKFRDAGLELRDNATGIVACGSDDGGATFNGKLTGNLVIDGGIFYDNGNAPMGVEHAKDGGTSQPALCTSAQYYGALPNVTPNGANPCNPGLENSYPDTGNDPNALFIGRPTFTGTCNVTPVDCTKVSDAFVDARYIGAFDPNGTPTGWLSTPWNSFDID